MRSPSSVADDAADSVAAGEVHIQRHAPRILAGHIDGFGPGAVAVELSADGMTGRARLQITGESALGRDGQLAVPGVLNRGAAGGRKQPGVAARRGQKGIRHEVGLQSQIGLHGEGVLLRRANDTVGAGPIVKCITRFGAGGHRIGVVNLKQMPAVIGRYTAFAGHPYRDLGHIPIPNRHAAHRSADEFRPMPP